MGYFTKPVRKSSARFSSRALLEATSLVDPSEWSSAPETSSDIRKSFVRLRIDFGGDRFTGFFIGAARIGRDPETPERYQRMIATSLKWFGRNLIAPREVDQAAVFWFRTSEHEMLARAWKIVYAVRKCDVNVFPETSHRPGVIVYEDRYQIAAIRFADAPTVSQSVKVLNASHQLLRNP